jgi:glycosyltransferase involved in cell wall biosynthesis
MSVATLPQLTSFAHGPSPTGSEAVELSIVMPCLNEAQTVGVCVEKAWRALRDHGIAGEVIVADNGSTDGSQDIAREHGARVVDVKEKGYGNALMGGISAARGRYVLMGDADDSYDFLAAPRFLARLREGAALVQGCRLPAGGGRVEPGAMPFLHRWLGNPLFSRLARVMFRSSLHDVNCGLRGFSKAFYERLNMRCTGMEFAVEMIIKASLFGEKIAEVPITLRPDGRQGRPPHLRTFRDGWRTLRFYLLYSPRWLFFIPGLALILAGLLGYAVALPGLVIGGVGFDVYTLTVASLLMLLGYQSVQFAVISRTFAMTEGFLPPNRAVTRFFQIFNLERGLLAGAAAMLVGGLLLFLAVNEWRLVHFGPLDYARIGRLVVPGITLGALGFQTVLTSFFLSLLGLRRR